MTVQCEGDQIAGIVSATPPLFVEDVLDNLSLHASEFVRLMHERSYDMRLIGWVVAQATRQLARDRRSDAAWNGLIILPPAIKSLFPYCLNRAMQDVATLHLDLHRNFDLIHHRTVFR